MFWLYVFDRYFRKGVHMDPKEIRKLIADCLKKIRDIQINPEEILQKPSRKDA